MLISDWSSDVCSSDLPDRLGNRRLFAGLVLRQDQGGEGRMNLLHTLGLMTRALNAPLSWIDERSQGVGVASDEARAATPSGLSRLASSSCQHRITNAGEV